jgi:hypothetical protein
MLLPKASMRRSVSWTGMAKIYLSSPVTPLDYVL